jgi:hypothetical protein
MIPDDPGVVGGGLRAASLASTGQLMALLALLDDAQQAHRSDEREVQQAVRDLGRLDAANPSPMTPK